MVWTGIWHGGRTAAVIIRSTLNSERYKNEIVLPVVIPTVQEGHLIFHDDNATPHRAGTVVRAAVIGADRSTTLGGRALIDAMTHTNVDMQHETTHINLHVVGFYCYFT